MRPPPPPLPRPPPGVPDKDVSSLSSSPPSSAPTANTCTVQMYNKQKRHVAAVNLVSLGRERERDSSHCPFDTWELASCSVISYCVDNVDIYHPQKPGTSCHEPDCRNVSVECVRWNPLRKERHITHSMNMKNHICTVNINECPLATWEKTCKSTLITLWKTAISWRCSSHSMKKTESVSLHVTCN